MISHTSKKHSGAEAFVPPALKPGETLAVVCPAGPPDTGKLEKGMAYLESLGYRTRLGWSPGQATGFLAGSDETRAEDLNSAFNDPDVRGIVCAWGGYGAMRILPLLDYAALRADPKRLFGYSDVTAIHMAVYRACGIVTYHGPNAGEFSDLHPSTDASFRAALAGGSALEVPGVRPSETVVEGQAEGPLVGGNLSLLTALQGTPWALSTRGCVLFFEDVHEESYRLDRMMTGLRLGGFFDDIRGVVVGRLSACGDSYGVSARTVIREHLQTLDMPSILDFPCGHVYEKLTLPLGQRVHLDATRAILRTTTPR